MSTHATTTKPIIAIIGAGWLGQPLVKHLALSGYSVYGTRTNQENLLALQKEGLDGFVTRLDVDNISTSKQLVNDLKDRKIGTIIGAFPPGFRKGQGEAYAHQWRLIIESAQQAGVTQIIMVSSTTVYPTSLAPLQESDASLSLAQNNPLFSDHARTMLQAEQWLIDSGLNYTIIRCSGLFGPHRHPARFVAKMPSVSRQAAANMLHQTDAIAILRFAITDLPNTIVNATAPTSVSKAEFYQAAIDGYSPSLKLPMIDDSPAKSISAQKLLKLGYQFKYQCAISGLSDCN